ncbi:MAG: hypothetical protein KJP18_13630, partial [Gemmatimonadetes bacterium]|nr:hypothetical protein [Gemmatimonadota bacterium]
MMDRRARVRLVRALGWCATAAVASAACDLATTEPPASVLLRIAPALQDGPGAPVLPVDALRLTVLDASDGALLAERTLAIAPSDIEVEVAIELAVPPGTPVVVELALTDGDRDVYRGGPVAVLPAEVPVPIPVSYVGELACEETVGEAVLGGLDPPPGVVDGRLDVGDCY